MRLHIFAIIIRVFYNQYWEEDKYNRELSKHLDTLVEHLEHIQTPGFTRLGLLVSTKKYKNNIKTEIKDSKRLIKNSIITRKFIRSKIQNFTRKVPLG